MFDIPPFVFDSTWITAGSGLTLIILGRWLLRAEAIASLIRTLGIFVILLGVLSLTPIVNFDISGASALADTFARLFSGW